MKTCIVCNKTVEISDLQDSDLYNDLQYQANALGMESLTESQQVFIEGRLCSDECYELLSDPGYGSVRSCGETCPNCVVSCPLKGEVSDNVENEIKGGE